MAEQKDVHTITGTAFYAKVLGAPKPAYNPGEKEWSIDVCVSPDTVAKLGTLGLSHEVKTKGDARGIFVSFKRRELKKKTGLPNGPITVLDQFAKGWPAEKLIGNGSTVSVKFKTFDVPAFGKRPAHKGWAILEIRVLDHVEYIPPAKPADEVSSDTVNWKTA